MKEDGEKEKKSVFRPEPASGLISKVYLAGSCLRHNGRQEEGGICIYMVGTLGNEGPPLAPLYPRPGRFSYILPARFPSRAAIPLNT